MKILCISNMRIANIGVLALVVLMCSLQEQGLADKVHTSVKNRLGNGQNLSLHCQSKDNDLGQQTVTDGSEFGWDFSANAWGTTLFYCDMSWDNAPQSSFSFSAYDFGRDYVRCQSQCLWLVSAEGMYALNGETGFWEYAYQWSISSYL